MNYFRNGSIANYWLSGGDVISLPADFGDSLNQAEEKEIRIHLPDNEPIPLGTLARLIGCMQSLITRGLAVQLSGDEATIDNLRGIGVDGVLNCVARKSA